MGRLEIDAIEA
jgi:hypothetical protein